MHLECGLLELADLGPQVDRQRSDGREEHHHFGCVRYGAPQFGLDLNQKGIWISDGCINNSGLSAETIRDPEPEA